MCFKLVNGDVDIEPNSFCFNNCMTRGHKYKLLKQSVRVDACKFSFANRAFTAWNNLPAMVVDSVITRLNTASLSQYCRYLV